MRTSSSALRVAPAGSARCTTEHSSRRDTNCTCTPRLFSNRGPKVRRLQAPTTTPSRPPSRTARRICSSPSGRQPKGTTCVTATPGRDVAKPSTLGRSTTDPMSPAQSQASTPIRARAAAAGRRAACGVARAAPPRRRRRQAPAEEGAHPRGRGAALGDAVRDVRGPAGRARHEDAGAPRVHGGEGRRAHEAEGIGLQPEALGQRGRVGGRLRPHGQHHQAEALLAHLAVLAAHLQDAGRGWRGPPAAPRGGSAPAAGRRPGAADRRRR